MKIDKDSNESGVMQMAAADGVSDTSSIAGNRKLSGSSDELATQAPGLDFYTAK